MESQPVLPEECLRSLTAEALLRATPGSDLLPDSLGVMATANAFVMLGMVAENRAEEILAGHRAALEAKGVAPGRGVNAGELTVRPGAHEYWTARGDSEAALTDLPLRVLPAGVRLPVTVSGQPGEIRFEWLTLVRSGWRMSYRATGRRVTAAPGAAERRHDPPGALSEQALTQVVVADDTGHRYQLTPGEGAGWLRAGRDRWELHGEAAADPNLLAEPGWLEFGNTAGIEGGRVRIQPPSDIPVGPAEPPWPTPAEAFIEHLARINGFNLNGSELTPDQTAGIVATVADCLLAVGALPASSPLLSEPRAAEQQWQAQLASRWSGRTWPQAAGASGAGYRLADHRGLAAELPLKRATVIVESVSSRGGLVIIRLYGHPWVAGEYWPMITPCFTVRATDDHGNSYRGMPGSWHGGTSHQGSGEFWFWPPVPEACERLTITVSTLWEAAWADVDLPGRTD